MGKFGIVCNPAAISAVAGYRTVLVDLDAQANSTQHLTGLVGDAVPLGIADFFKQTLSSGPARNPASLFTRRLSRTCI